MHRVLFLAILLEFFECVADLSSVHLVISAKEPATCARSGYIRGEPAQVHMAHTIAM